MGFEEQLARNYLIEAKGDVQKAVGLAFK